MEQESLSSLRTELIAMMQADQAMRTRSHAKGEWDSSVDEHNTQRLKEIIAEIGWPKLSQIGLEAAQAAWLIAQHADADVPFQQECLGLMRQLSKDETLPNNIAYLEDRVRVNTGQAQLYGTQFFGTADSFGPRPIEDESKLDERRMAVGLESFADYKARMEELNQQSRAVAKRRKKTSN